MARSDIQLRALEQNRRARDYMEIKRREWKWIRNMLRKKREVAEMEVLDRNLQGSNNRRKSQTTWKRSLVLKAVKEDKTLEIKMAESRATSNSFEYSMLLQNITLTEVAYCLMISYQRLLQHRILSATSVTATSQIQVSTMLLLPVIQN
jgi:hypothetical protein